MDTSGCLIKKKEIMKRFILFLLILSAAQDILAQKAEVRSGNKLYQERKFTEAAAAYQSALQKNPTYAPAIFNLGTAQYQQKNFGGARQSFTNTAKVAKDRNVKADAHYNIGNSYMEEKEWEKAIEEYKEALRSNPQDEAAKYNLSYAKAMLKKQEGSILLFG
ncbi:MAG: tetratricopeptide repeat protein, partial [Sphingobacteriales bacterium]